MKRTKHTKKNRKTKPLVLKDTGHFSNVLKALEAVTSRGHQPVQVLNDWIELMFWAFQRNDEEYLKVVGRYKNDAPTGKREIDLFTEALAELMLHMRQTNEETLSRIYMDFNPNKKIGQFFTPPSLCQLMAEIICPNHGYIVDPACGAGTMLVYAAKNMTCTQVDKSLFIGQDIDRTCVQMTALNLMFFNLPGVVVLGNTLALEVKEVYITKRSYLYGGSLHKDPNVDKWQRFFQSTPIKRKLTRTKFPRKEKRK